MNINQIKFNDFINNVYCRRESNQHKARKLWDEIEHCFPDKIKTIFKTEWNHYYMNEFNSDKFGIDIEILKTNFNKNNNK